MDIKNLEKVARVQAMKFEGTYESGMELCKWMGSGSRYIPDTKTDPFKYVQIPTMFGPRDIEEGYWVVQIDSGSFLPYKESALFNEYNLIEAEEAALVKHARYELSKFSNEEPEFVASIIAAVKGFCEYKGHSGGSASVARHMLMALIDGDNLLPLTDDPNEWELRAGADYGLEEDMWQNVRNSKAISMNGGRTYFLASEPENENGGRKMYESEDQRWVPEIDPEDLKSDEEKAEELKTEEDLSGEALLDVVEEIVNTELSPESELSPEAIAELDAIDSGDFLTTEPETEKPAE